MTHRTLLPILFSTVTLALAACTIEQKDSQGSAGAAGDGSGNSAGSTTAGAAGTAGAAAGAGAGGGPAGAGGAKGDPCKGFSADGACTSASSYSFCAAPSGQGDPTLQTVICKGWETCKVSSKGQAACELKPGACTPGASRCSGSAAREDCSASGAWVSSACAGCKETPAGPVCQTGASGTVSGTIKYELKFPTDDYTGWEPDAYVAVAPGALVMSVKKGVGGEPDELIDSTVTDADGNFTVKEAEAIQVYAISTQPGGAQNGLRYAVIEPNVPDGQWSLSSPVPTDDASFWGWEWPKSAFAGGQAVTIHYNEGSGAMRLFDYLRFVYDSTAMLQGGDGLPLVVWFRYNTSWSCGACQQKAPVTVGGFDFDAQVWIPATAKDESYWSDAVTAHELGHWVMSSWGRSPGEGGRHYLGCPTFPGQAWSEGWATGFSTITRADPVYFDKQSGTFFWINIEQRKYSSHSWVYPSASDGLLQLLDENEVSAEIWDIAQHPVDPNASLSSNKTLVSALAHPSVAKNFKRGYTRHVWDLGSGCSKTDVVDLGTPAPMFADYLDALRCSGISAATVDQGTSGKYPYPSSSPICQ